MSIFSIAVCKSILGFLTVSLKRIKIDDDYIYRVNIHTCEKIHMLFIVSHCQETGVYLGVQSLYSAVKTLGKARHRRDVDSFTPAALRVFNVPPVDMIS